MIGMVQAAVTGLCFVVLLMVGAMVYGITHWIIDEAKGRHRRRGVTVATTPELWGLDWPPVESETK